MKAKNELAIDESMRQEKQYRRLIGQLWRLRAEAWRFACSAATARVARAVEDGADCYIWCGVFSPEHGAALHAMAARQRELVAEAEKYRTLPGQEARTLCVVEAAAPPVLRVKASHSVRVLHGTAGTVALQAALVEQLAEEEGRSAKAQKRERRACYFADDGAPVPTGALGVGWPESWPKPEAIAVVREHMRAYRYKLSVPVGVDRTEQLALAGGVAVIVPDGTTPVLVTDAEPRTEKSPRNRIHVAGKWQKQTKTRFERTPEGGIYLGIMPGRLCRKSSWECWTK